MAERCNQPGFVFATMFAAEDQSAVISALFNRRRRFCMRGLQRPEQRSEALDIVDFAKKVFGQDRARLRTQKQNMFTFGRGRECAVRVRVKECF